MEKFDERSMGNDYWKSDESKFEREEIGGMGFVAAPTEVVGESPFAGKVVPNCIGVGPVGLEFKCEVQVI